MSPASPPPLHGYQEAAVAFLRGRDRAGLFLDMGLGKTACVLSALEPRHLPALVVGPKRVVETTWGTEAALWRPDLRISIAAGSPKQRRQALEADADIYALSRDNLNDALDYPGRFRTVVIDELSWYKGRGSRWKSMAAIVGQRSVEHVWGLTGTPMPKGLLDLFPQIMLLDRGERLGRHITHYRSRYFTPGRSLPNGTIIEYVPRPEAFDAIMGKIDDLCMSMRTEGVLELPPMTFNPVPVLLPPKARSAYNDIRYRMLTDLRELFGTEVHTAPSAAAVSGRLSQISAGFVYADVDSMTGRRYTTVHMEKINAAREIVDEAGSPVLIFYRFRWELERLREALPQAVEISAPDSVARWNAGEIPVLLAHPMSAGHGLNLQHGGHVMLWTSLPWGLEEWEQSIKRLSRQGQKNHVMCHVLMAEGTIDHLIYQRLQEKADVQRAVMDHLECPL